MGGKGQREPQLQHQESEGGKTVAEERQFTRHLSLVCDPAALVKLCTSETAAPSASDGLLLNLVLVMRGRRGHGR